MFALGIEDVPSEGILVVEDVGEEFAHDWLGLRRKREDAPGVNTTWELYR
jgi:hypothetical protein